MSVAAREAILQSIRKGRGPVPAVPVYSLGPLTNDAASLFAGKAQAAVASVHRIASPNDAPETILALLKTSNAPLRLHIPSDSLLNALPWRRAAGLSLSSKPPTGVDTAFSAANYGIAETGTLVFFSGKRTPSSWHYRPGREIVLLDHASILPRLEDVIARLSSMPATVNLVTGPSRTADIEQTIELGAHGPRALDILVSG